MDGQYCVFCVPVQVVGHMRCMPKDARNCLQGKEQRFHADMPWVDAPTLLVPHRSLCCTSGTSGALQPSRSWGRQRNQCEKTCSANGTQRFRRRGKSSSQQRSGKFGWFLSASTHMLDAVKEESVTGHVSFLHKAVCGSTPFTHIIFQPKPHMTRRGKLPHHTGTSPPWHTPYPTNVET